MSTSGGSAGGGLLLAAVQIGSPARGALHSVPVALVAAPGANRAVAIVQVTTELAIGATGYNYPGVVACYYGAPVVGNQASVSMRIAMLAEPPEDYLGVGSLNTAATDPVAVDKDLAANTAVVFGAATADGDPAGPITTAALADGGAGYAPGDTGTIGPDSTTGDDTATYHVTTVGAAGVVTAFTVTAAGIGYSPSNNPQPTAVGGAQPGVGTGLTVNVTAIPAASGSLYVTALYRVLTLH